MRQGFDSTVVENLCVSSAVQLLWSHLNKWLPPIKLSSRLFGLSWSINWLPWTYFMLCSPFSIIGGSHFRLSTQTDCADDQHDPTWLIYHHDHNGRTDLPEIHQIFPHLQINHQFSSLFIQQTSCVIFVSWHRFVPMGPSFISNYQVPLVC